MKNKVRDVFINAGIFVAANVFGFYLSLLGDRLFYWHVCALAAIFRIFDNRRFKDCLHNLDLAYDNTLSESEKNRILKRCYKNFAFVILNALRLLFYDKEEYLAKFRVHSEEIADEAIEKGNFIVLTAHYGDWEGTSRWFATRKKNTTLSVVGRLTQFRTLNLLMEKSRQIYGSKFFDKSGVSKHLIRLLNKPHNVIGLVIDQHISPNEGVFVKFFGKDVTHTSIASILSRKYNVPILFCWTRLNENYSRYDIFFARISDGSSSGDMKSDILSLTQAQADFTEKIIRESPHEWFWFHKRFKARYGDIYTY